MKKDIRVFAECGFGDMFLLTSHLGTRKHTRNCSEGNCVNDLLQRIASLGVSDCRESDCDGERQQQESLEDIFIMTWRRVCKSDR
jgi:hypothetical protein